MVLPAGRKAIGVKWTYTNKFDIDGHPIAGKEKVRLVAQGFSQRLEAYDENYAPVVKMTSIRILLAHAAHRNLEIKQFDCKTVFLHAKNSKNVYCKQTPGYPLANASLVLKVLVALYGLRQAANKFYKLIKSIFLELGLLCCPVDQAVFYGTWKLPPDSSIPMPEDGSPLVLYIILHLMMDWGL